MRALKAIVFSLVIVLSDIAYAEENATAPQSISTLELKGFEYYPPKVQKLILRALELTKRNLIYQYGSANPKNGGMDCSGTIYYLLQSFNQKDTPRQSDQIYVWAIKNGKFYVVKSSTFDSSEFDYLKPGDLLFWSGTYPIKRTVPITHVMLYLGKNERNEHVMFGASDGRTYQGKQIWGVSVFDFKLPPENSESHFIGYSCIPNISC